MTLTCFLNDFIYACFGRQKYELMYMKSIRITGKRNIDSIDGNKISIRSGQENQVVISHEGQVIWINKLYMNIEFERNTIIRSELNKKISSYKAQDIKKEIYDATKLISIDELLEKLVSSKLKCCYCNEHVKIQYNISRDPYQWTLDRKDNNECHSNINTLISCMKCNLDRRVTDFDKFMFTKKLVIRKS